MDPYHNQNPPARTATLVYILQALSFFTVITWIIAVIISYLKFDDTRGTWIESHFRWQIRTFWWGTIWAFIGGVTTWFLIGYLILGLNFIWVIYRIFRGWTRLSVGQPMDV